MTGPLPPGLMPPGLAEISAWFTDCYGGPPECAWRAPGRANLIGEHTDYNDGLALPFALERRTVAAVARRADGLLAVRSRQVPGPGVRVPLDKLEPGAVTGWAAYPAGVLWALRAAGHQVGGVSLAIDSDLPQGAGLASSAALECAVAMAVTSVHGLAVSRPELVTLTRRAENDFVRMPCGMLDQSASLLCRAGCALLLDCRTGSGVPVPLGMAAAGASLMIIDTMAAHVLADGAYAARRRECAEAARSLGVPALRDITEFSGLASLLADPMLRRRARHVITENQRVKQSVALLRSGDVAGVGALLSESHRSLRDDFEVSWPEADAVVAAAAGAGTLGARMMGGGFGGSVIALLPEDRAVPVRTAVQEAFRGRGWRPPEFMDAVPADGAGRIG
jgi:galactokinase